MNHWKTYAITLSLIFYSCLVWRLAYDAGFKRGNAVGWNKGQDLLYKEAVKLGYAKYGNIYQYNEDEDFRQRFLDRSEFFEKVTLKEWMDAADKLNMKLAPKEEEKK